MTAPLWIAASYVLRRPVPTDQPYPHICGTTATGKVTGRLVRLWRKDCAGCNETPEVPR